MPVRVALWANGKSSRSLMFLTAPVTCTTLFMKAILRQTSCAQTRQGTGRSMLGVTPKPPSPGLHSRTPRPHRTLLPTLKKSPWRGAERQPPHPILSFSHLAGMWARRWTGHSLPVPRRGAASPTPTPPPPNSMPKNSNAHQWAFTGAPSPGITAEAEQVMEIKSSLLLRRG